MKSLIHSLNESITSRYDDLKECSDSMYSFSDAFDMDEEYEEEQQEWAVPEDDPRMYSNDMEWEINWIDNYYDESLNEYISPEDKRDSDLIRSAHRKIGGKKVGKNTLSAEEQDALNRKGLDAWGFRGETKVVSPGGNDIFKDKDGFFAVRNGHSTSKQDVKNMNLADRGAKLDARAVNRDIATAEYGTIGTKDHTYQQSNRAYDAQQISDKTNRMKAALQNRKYYQNDLDTADDNLAKNIIDASDAYTKKAQELQSRSDAEVKRYRDRQSKYQSEIDRILAKHKRECLEALETFLGSLNEAEMSAEDKKDSEIIRNVAIRLKNRKNARITPDEQAVLDKYGLLKHDYSDNVLGTGRTTFKNLNNPKINFADQARKADDRVAKNIDVIGTGDPKQIRRSDTYQDVARAHQGSEMSKDYRDMKHAVDWRNTYKRWADADEKETPEKIAALKAKRDSNIQDRIKYNNQRKDRAKEQIAKSQATIDDLLKRESLDEAEGRIVKTGLSGEVNHAILESVIGQMSDGIWENSPGYDKYWLFVNINSNNDIVVSGNRVNQRWNNKPIFNPYLDMDDAEVRKFFANKIKYIAQLFMHDNNINPYKGWNADNEEECTYLDRAETDVTVGDAFRAYQALK